MKNTKTANINISLKQLFSVWLEITSSFHKLRKQEKKVLSLFLYHYFKLKQEITNDTILWKVLFDYDKKEEIKKELNMPDQSFRNILTSLRKKNVIKDEMISNIYIPTLENKSKNFKVIFNFNIIDG